MKSRDRRQFFYEIVDFPIRKQHFGVRGWSGAFLEPLERKKRQNQMFLYAPVWGVKKRQAFFAPPKKSLLESARRAKGDKKGDF